MQGLAVGASRVEAAPAEPEKVWTPTGWVDAPKTKAKPAAIAQAEGRLIACDVVQKRLDNIKPRLARAGVEAELIHLGPNGGGVEDIVGKADVVFVDAPCTGSGTWRRRPEDAWRLKPRGRRPDALAAEGDPGPRRQAGEAGRAAGLCHLLDADGSRTRPPLDAFEEDHPAFAPVADRRTPWSSSAFTDAARNKLAELARAVTACGCRPRRPAPTASSPPSTSGGREPDRSNSATSAR